MLLERRSIRATKLQFIVAAIAGLMLILAACGGDDSDDADIASDPDPAPTETVVDEPTPEPALSPTEAATDNTPADEPEPTPADVSEDPTSEPAPDVDLAPELAGLTDWRNIEEISLEELRGEPVVLVFWNSI